MSAPDCLQYFIVGNQEAARLKGKQAKAVFRRVPPDGATLSSVITPGRTVQDFCVAWNERGLVAAKIRNAAGGFAGEHIQGLRMDFRLCERMKACRMMCLKWANSTTKGHGSSHEPVTVSRKKCDMPCPESVDSQACRASMLYRKNNLLLCFHWKIGSKQVVVLGMAHYLPNWNRGVPIYLRVGCIRAKRSMQSLNLCEAYL